MLKSHQAQLVMRIENKSSNTLGDRQMDKNIHEDSYSSSGAPGDVIVIRMYELMFEGLSQVVLVYRCQNGGHRHTQHLP